MEYATEYTKVEKIVRLSVFACVGLILVVLHQNLLLPLITDIAERPHCYELFGFSAVDYFWHPIFIGIPVSAFAFSSAVMLPIGFMGIKEGRFPPKSVKVYKPTVVKSGAVAYIKSGAHILLPAMILMLSIWGFHQIENMPQIDKQKLDFSLCQEN